jgi:hypothetical protein
VSLNLTTKIKSLSGSLISGSWRGFCLQKTMKTVVNKVKRSGVYYLMTTVATTDETKSARSDTWGILAVVLLLLGVVGLMRLVLTV